MKTRRYFFQSLMAASALFSSLASAATWYWDGSASTANNASDNASSTALSWLNGGNWDNGTTSAARASWTSGDVAIFGGTFTGTQTVTLSSGISVGSGSIIGGVGSSYKISVTGTGYNQLGNPSGTMTVNAGSTLSADAASNNAQNIGAITLNGGTLTSANGSSGAANDNGYGNWLTRGVTVGGSTVSTINSATLYINSGSYTVADSVTGSATDLLVSAKIVGGALIKEGAGTMELTAANTSTSTTINAGTVVVTGASGALGTGAVTVASGANLSWATSGGRTLSNTITGAGSLTKSDTGRYTFNGNLSGFTGTYTQSAGQTSLSSVNSGSASANWVLNGTYFVSNVGTATLQLGALSGSALHWNDSGSGTVSTLEVGALGTDTTFSGNLGSGTNGGTTALTKVGSGKLSLSAGNSYSGATRINGGTLALTSSGSINNSTSISVGSGAFFDVSAQSASTFTLGGGKTLKGKGTVTGNVAVATSGIGVVTGGDGVNGTLTITGNLKFQGLGDVNVGTLSNYTGSSALVVAGDLTALGGTGSIYVNLPAIAVEAGIYHLISHANTLADIDAFTLGTLPLLSARQVGNLVNNAGTIDYVVSGSNPVWTGALNSTWSTATLDNPKNWNLSGGGPTDYIEGDAVLFNDSATGSTTVDLAADVSPIAIEFANSTKHYILQGSGFGITGTGSLFKSGTGDLTINSPNSFEGGSTLAGGTVTLGTSTALGIGNVSLNGGTLALNGQSISNAVALGGGDVSGNGTLSGVISGGALTYHSAGNTLVLTGSNTYTGSTTVTAGTVQVGVGGTTGVLGGTGDITIASGADLRSNRSDAVNLGRRVVGGGMLIQDGGGSLRTGQGGNNVDVTVNGGVFEALDGGWATSYFATANRLVTINNGGTFVTDTHSLGGLGGAYYRPDIVINQGGTWQLNHEQYFSAGDLVINGGVIHVVANDLRLDAGTVLVGASTNGSAISGSEMKMFGSVAFDVADGAAAADLTISAKVSGSGVHSLSKSGNGTMTLTGANTYTGATTVNAGTIELNGSLVSNITVNASGTLKGSGSTTGTLTVSGTVSPGTDIGTLTVGTTTITGSYACNVDATNADVLAVSGDLNLSNATLVVHGSLSAASYTIATYTGSLNGSFVAAPSGYVLDYGTGSNSVVKLVKAGGFGSWIGGFGLALADQDPQDDPDGDGINNLMEYAIAGRNPAVADGALGDFDGSVVSFSKRAEAAADANIAYQIQESDDLGVADAWVEVASYEKNNGTTISYKLPIGKTKTFARLVVTQTNP